MKPMMRRREVLRLIEARGYSEHAFKTLVENGAIHKKEIVPGHSRAYYYRAEIEEHFPEQQPAHP